MDKKYFIKFIENSPEFCSLIQTRPSALLLLILIAYRARKVQIEINDGLEVGEAFIGDYKYYGATEQSYRTDKEQLQSNGLITTRATGKGTIAKLVSSSIFNISRDVTNGVINGQSTDNQRRSNGGATTKQEVRDKKEEERNNNIDTNEKNSVSSSTPYKTHDLERFIFNGETEKEKEDREWWEKTASELGYSVEETKRRFHQK